MNVENKLKYCITVTKSIFLQYTYLSVSLIYVYDHRMSVFVSRPAFPLRELR